MSPSLEPVLRGLVADGDVSAARLVLADWMITEVSSVGGIEHDRVTSIFLDYFPPILPMLDTANGVHLAMQALMSLAECDFPCPAPTIH